MDTVVEDRCERKEDRSGQTEEKSRRHIRTGKGSIGGFAALTNF